MNGLEKEFPFCSNPNCELCVRAGDPGVVGPAIGPSYPMDASSAEVFIAGCIFAIRADANGYQ